ncbi:hypothetical protein NP233_g4442 [Leucocoprinus birnbaumii]|uniref:Uncharacterized protein n=1 Tax=Leucocoprinus birnbaumii TaxID=56174 RepID=A0AAD5VX88_9AGAR|nr:hypothetical protein NP233_g4442 [Leucocoprinus birnbaumii]
MVLACLPPLERLTKWDDRLLIQEEPLREIFTSWKLQNLTGDAEEEQIRSLVKELIKGGFQVSISTMHRAPSLIKSEQKKLQPWVDMLFNQGLSGHMWDRARATVDRSVVPFLVKLQWAFFNGDDKRAKDLVKGECQKREVPFAPLVLGFTPASALGPPPPLSLPPPLSPPPPGPPPLGSPPLPSRAERKAGRIRIRRLLRLQKLGQNGQADDPAPPSPPPPPVPTVSRMVQLRSGRQVTIKRKLEFVAAPYKLPRRKQTMEKEDGQLSGQELPEQSIQKPSRTTSRNRRKRKKQRLAMAMAELAQEQSDPGGIPPDDS